PRPVDHEGAALPGALPIEKLGLHVVRLIRLPDDDEVSPRVRGHLPQELIALDYGVHAERRARRTPRALVDPAEDAEAVVAVVDVVPGYDETFRTRRGDRSAKTRGAQ